MTSPRSSRIGRFLRLYLWALLAALAVGFGIGLLIRHRLEKPRVQMGDAAQDGLQRASAGTRSARTLGFDT